MTDAGHEHSVIGSGDDHSLRGCGFSPHPWEAFSLADRCGRSADYLTRSAVNGHIFALCAEHAAVTRACPTCNTNRTAIWSANAEAGVRQ